MGVMYLKNRYLTIPQVAGILGISRIAVYKKVKLGRIESIRIGRNFVIPQKVVVQILKAVPSKKDKTRIDDAITKIVKEYGEVLKLLGKE